MTRVVSRIVFSATAAALLLFLSSTNGRLGAVLSVPGFVLGRLLFPDQVHGGQKLIWTMNIVNYVCYFGLVFLLWKAYGAVKPDSGSSDETKR